jgi:hypothetical protein
MGTLENENHPESSLKCSDKRQGKKTKEGKEECLLKSGNHIYLNNYIIIIHM